MLVAMALLMGLGGILFPLTEEAAFLVAISLMAMTTSTGGDRTAFLSLDMAILAQSGSSSQRTMLFSWYNLLGRLTKALGSLMIAVPAALQAWLGMEEVASYKAMFLAYSVIAFAGVAIYWRLTPSAESMPAAAPESEPPPDMPRSARTIMVQLAVLFSLDSLGGGFMVQSFMSFFFANRFNMSLETIAAIFFAGQILNAVSIMLAVPIARRIGLITTMAASQGLANSVMILMALTGNWLLAVLFFLTKGTHKRHGYSYAAVLLHGHRSDRSADRDRECNQPGTDNGTGRQPRAGGSGSTSDRAWHSDNRGQSHQAGLQRGSVRNVQVGQSAGGEQRLDASEGIGFT